MGWRVVDHHIAIKCILKIKMTRGCAQLFKTPQFGAMLVWHSRGTLSG